MLLLANIGYNPTETYEPRGLWGLRHEPERKQVWLPRGIVFPWAVGGEIWKVNVRRPKDTDGRGKYITIAGSANALYGLDSLVPRTPAVIVEGVIDALVTQQACRSNGTTQALTGVVATGTTQARRMEWTTELIKCSTILVALDNDAAGDQYAPWWIDVLAPKAQRWRPLLKDAGEMAEAQLDVRAWIEAGLNIAEARSAA